MAKGFGRRALGIVINIKDNMEMIRKMVMAYLPGRLVMSIRVTMKQI